MTIHIFNTFFHIRHIFLILFLTIIIASDSFAQESSNLPSIPKKGDKISRRYVEHLSTETRGISVLWDLRDLVQLKDVGQVTYDSLPSHPNCITGIEKGTRHYYAILGDTLSLEGMENNYMSVHYDNCLPEIIPSMVYGSKLSGYFQGNGGYCDNILYKESGKYNVEVDGEGCILMQDGDTISNVLRMHIERFTTTSYYPSDSAGIKALSCMLTSNDIERAMSSDTALLRTDIYRWYTLDSRYPLLEAHAISQNNRVLMKTAFINYDETDDNIRQNSPIHKSSKGQMPLPSCEPSRDMSSSLPFSDIKYCVNGSGADREIAIKYRVTKSKFISMSLHAPNGSLLWKMPSSERKEGVYREIISFSNLQEGIYILSIESEGEKYSKKITVI